jgi:5-methyltetrahydropteroyltriglutamate--homocysteine methyltransferase
MDRVELGWDANRRKIEGVKKFVDLARLVLSPQCGFASNEGNVLAEEEQSSKLRTVVEIANEVRGRCTQ